MKKILLFISALITATLSFTPALMVHTYAQSSKDAVCEGLQLTGGGADCQASPGEATVDSTIRLVINVLSILVGVAAVIMIIIGGFKYITSSGDSAGINSAKNTILFAIIGLVIVAMAQIIVRFVIERVDAA